MIDKRQVIYDIERCICNVPDACRDCSHYTGTVGFGCMESLMADTLALLKEQIPRIMTLEEIIKNGDDEPLFLEYVLPKKTVLKPAVFQPENSDMEKKQHSDACVVSAWCASGFYNINEYGKTWRCWTTRPTDEQRKEAKWE